MKYTNSDLTNFLTLFDLVNPLEKLPSLTKLQKLEFLDIGFLGLKTLPEIKVDNLKKLDISFNYIEYYELYKFLSHSNNLEEIKIYGISINHIQYLSFCEKYPIIKILFTRKDMLNDLK